MLWICTPLGSVVSRLGRLCLVLAFGWLTSINSLSAEESFIRLKQTTPPGFENLSAKQVTQADLYYAGEYLTHVFVEFDPYTIEIQALEDALSLIPNLRDPGYIAQYLSGPQPTGSEHLCTRARRIDCGELHPAVAGLIFNEGTYRIDLFLHRDQLLVHEVALDKYLPASESELANLHNIRMNASGSQGSDFFNLSSESYLSHRQQRLLARYGFSNDGPQLYELAWQRDDRDMEYHVGSIRSAGGNLAFAPDADLLGFRIATSTKTRVDLDQSLASPILLFLPTRSRVDVFRGDELLDSRFYASGNQQLLTTALPDGAYDVTIRIEGIDGTVRNEEHFFVRSPQMPAIDEPQFYVEGGQIVELERGALPSAVDGGWFRAGASLRLHDHLAWDSELHHANGQTVVSSGVLYLQPQWHIYAGALLGARGEVGTSVRGSWYRDQMRLTFDLQHLQDGSGQTSYEGYSITRGGYTQANATLVFPIGDGQLALRGRINDRIGRSEHAFGVSYLGSVFRRSGMTADLVVDGGVSTEGNWIKAGINFRWNNHEGYSAISPHFRYQEGVGFDPQIAGVWHAPQDLPGFGRVEQTVFADHNGDNSALGMRLFPAEFQQTELELGYRRMGSVAGSSAPYYAINNRFSVVNSKHGTTIGDGGSSAGAVIVNVAGDVQGQFAVLIGGRRVGIVKAGQPNVISLRPYETYQIKISPMGDAIVSYDAAPVEVTLYPGNVQTVNFSAKKIAVLIGQAVFEDGSPVQSARITNVEGYAGTDQNGWYQVEVAHSDPLLVQLRSGNMCRLNLPEYEVVDGLAVLDPVVCQAIPVTL
ncbi:MAG: CS1-pili formation C-terminal domain-containing protein [Pseudomonadota bacterium]